MRLHKIGSFRNREEVGCETSRGGERRRRSCSLSASPWTLRDPQVGAEVASRPTKFLSTASFFGPESQLF